MGIISTDIQPGTHTKLECLSFPLYGNNLNGLSIALSVIKKNVLVSLYMGIISTKLNLVNV